ncbi:hypothetical protein OAE47_00775 [Akkermansiaceae bacterium]|nr:hypothetical protein [Akkermansiaceae bacterium]
MVPDEISRGEKQEHPQGSACGPSQAILDGKLEGLSSFKEFKHLERFTLNDRRDFGRDKLLKQIMAIPKPESVAFGLN